MSTEVEKAWIACAIDGEGSILWVDDRSSRQLKVLVGNTDVSFAKHAQTIFQHYGSSANLFVQHPKNPRHKTFYLAHIGGRKAQEFLREIIPYLIIKRQKAEAAIAVHIMTNREAGFQNGKLRRGKKWPLEARLSLALKRKESQTASRRENNVKET